LPLAVAVVPEIGRGFSLDIPTPPQNPGFSPRDMPSFPSHNCGCPILGDGLIVDRVGYRAHGSTVFLQRPKNLIPLN